MTEAKPKLTFEEKAAAARARARAKIEAEREKKLLAKIEEEEAQRLRLEEGLDSDEPMVDLVLDLPLDFPFIAIDGVRWFNGAKIRVRESVAKDIMHRAYCGHRNDAVRRGIDTFTFQHMRPQAQISPVAVGKVPESLSGNQQ